MNTHLTLIEYCKILHYNNTLNSHQNKLLYHVQIYMFKFLKVLKSKKLRQYIVFIKLNNVLHMDQYDTKQHSKG